MLQRLWSAACLGLLCAAMALGSCGGEQTGPATEASADAPDAASAVPPAASNPELVNRNVGFAGTDTDRDGRLSSAEYAASSTRLFSAMDIDDDGGLTVSEMDGARIAMRINGGPSSEKMIANADNDGDEKLTIAEFVGDVNRRFARVDTDADGFLTRQEFDIGHPEVGAAARSAPASPQAPDPATR